MRTRLASLVAVVVLGACSAAGAGSPQAPAQTTAMQSVAAASPSATPSATPAAATLAPATTAPARPTPTPAATAPALAPAGCVVLERGVPDAQVVLAAPSGRRVFIDVTEPDETAPPTARDVLLVTHSHEDHYLASFASSFPGAKIVMHTGSLMLDDIHAVSIRGEHHSDPDQSIPDFIFVVDVAGVRIVHLGDLGQEQLTKAQLAAIGTPDVLFAQITNSFSGIAAGSDQGIRLVNQIHPRVIVPTHIMEAPIDDAKMAAAAWPAFYTPDPWITVASGTLEGPTRLLFFGSSAAAQGKITGASGW